MTSRYEITNILQRELAHIPEIFGTLEEGNSEDPAVTIVRRHYFLKYVSGAPLVRPIWYFDTEQEGKGIVDVTTHLVDQVQWVCFPKSVFDYAKDIKMNTAKRWTTAITKDAFTKITRAENFPAYLQKDVKDSILYVDANGEMNYTIKGIHVKITMLWDVQPEDGAVDAHFSTVRGSKARLAIRQGKEEQYHAVLYIEKNKIGDTAFSKSFVESKMQAILQKYPGISLKENAKGWELVIPSKYSEGHEQNFRKVATKFLDYVRQKKMPDWEISAMLTKYYTTTQALEKSTLIQK
jgi:predicted dehydrogenase